MKRLANGIISVGLLVLVSACSEKTAPLPPPGISSAQSSSSSITERTLNTTERSSGADVKQVFQPISTAVVPDPAVSQGSAVHSSEGVSLGFVNGRIFEFEQRMARWQELDDQSTIATMDEQQTELMLTCYRSLQKLLKGYRELQQVKHQAGDDPVPPGASVNATEILRDDVAFLEGNCNTMLGGGETGSAGWQSGGNASAAGQLEAQIRQHYRDKEYSEIITLWEQIPAYQASQLDPRTRMYYGNALMHQDQPAQAAEVYQKIVDERAFASDQPMDLISMRKMLADLYTAAGNYLTAEGQYDKVSADYLNIGKTEEWSKQQLLLLERSYIDNPELDDYAKLLRAYLAFVVERDGFQTVAEAEGFLQRYPYSPVSANVDIIKEDVQIQAGKWFENLLIQIDSSIEEKDYETALEEIQAIPLGIVGEENGVKLSQREEAINTARELERLTVERERLQDVQNKWDRALSLTEQGDIDGALVLFTELLDTEEYSEKAEMQIQDLSLAAAKAERRQAADYFVKFSKATDVETKKEMLIESRRILKGILKKYPDVEIAAKVSGNIRRVEKEMNTIDPLLLPAIEQKEWEEAVREQQQQEPEAEEVDVFDLPLSQPVAPEPVKSIQPLPVIIPQPAQ